MVARKNSCAGKFYGNIPEYNGTMDDMVFPFSLEHFADMSAEAVYVIDFQRRLFQYVSGHGLFLCGYSREEVMSLSYDFYNRIVHKNDLQLWEKMHNIILRRLYNPYFSTDKVNYFSCTFRIMNPLQTGNRSDFLMVYHKLKPVLLNGKVQFGICMLSGSVISNSGNLRMNYKDTFDYDEYDFNSEKWTRQKEQSLTVREKQLLMTAQQGKTRKEMAKAMCISIQLIDSIATSLFEKLGVKTMMQAVIFAINHRLVYDGNTVLRKDEIREKTNHAKVEDRHELTSDILSHIQTGLKKGRSVNAMAKETGFTETALRNAIQRGKLKKIR
jgi:DNA-binding CsgD family transcriptional regulator